MTESTQHTPRDVLPRPVRLVLGATSPGVDQRRLRDAVAGKVVLITGASSGVGEAAARRLGAAGAIVLLVARRVDRLEQLRGEIVAAGGVAHVHPADLADIERVEALAAEVLARHGHVDVIVSNAGISIRRWVSDSYERFHDVQRTTAVNYLGPVRLILALLPSMRARRSGHVVNIATAGVGLPSVEWSAYLASKSALETWLRTVAPEVLADGVATTSIHLQLVRSPMLGPFPVFRYIPGMSTDEAAGIIARAIVDRPRTIMPWWERVWSPLGVVAQVPAERAQALYAQRVNPASRDHRRVGGLVGAVATSARVADDALGGLRTIRASHVVRPVRPDRLARALAAQRRFGMTPAATFGAAAELHGDRTALIDELGSLTFSEVDARARAIAAALHDHFDLRAGRRIALMCRNHRGFVDAAVAGTRLGCDLVLLNTDFAGPQLADVLAREHVDAAIHDEEFSAVFEAAAFAGPRVVAWHDGDPGLPTLDALIAVGGPQAPAPRRPGRVVLMTSGTTGTPKGVARGRVDPRNLVPLAFSGLMALSKIKPTPRSGQPILVAPPLFHMYGFMVTMAAPGLGSPVVLRRRFDPEETLADIDRHRVAVLCVVPTMLKRIMDLGAETRGRYDASSLRMVPCGAAPLPPDLALAFMDEFGDVLYNGYASTESGSGTLATPADLRAAPGTVGRPPHGVTVKILDEEGLELPRGTTGRVFIGSGLLFDGYSDGSSKDFIDGLMRSGDVGHFDDSGRLFIDGRDDDMILSGGENVYPQEVEELLASHPGVADAAVVGVPDEDFGQRLAAFVVKKPKARVSAAELKKYVGAQLARYKVPRDVTFVDELPRTSTGKLRRKALGGAA